MRVFAYVILLFFLLINNSSAEELKSGIYGTSNCEVLIHIREDKYIIYEKGSRVSGNLIYEGRFLTFDGFEGGFYSGENYNQKTGAMPASVEKRDEFHIVNYGNSMNPFIFFHNCSKFLSFILKEDVFFVKKKSYLYASLLIPTKMYLIKGDIVTLLDEKFDEKGQKWYFINYKGKKDLNMWIKARAIDVYNNFSE